MKEYPLSHDTPSPMLNSHRELDNNFDTITYLLDKIDTSRREGKYA